MHEAGDGHVGVFSTGIRHFGGIGVSFLDAGNDLTADGAVGIGGVDEVEVMRSDSGGELGSGEENAGAFFFAESEVFLDVSEGGDAVL